MTFIYKINAPIALLKSLFFIGICFFSLQNVNSQEINLVAERTEGVLKSTDDGIQSLTFDSDAVQILGSTTQEYVDLNLVLNDKEEYKLNLEQYDVYPSKQIKYNDKDAEVDYTLRTYKGTISGVQDSWVTLTIVGNYLTINFALDEKEYTIEPILSREGVSKEVNYRYSSTESFQHTHIGCLSNESKSHAKESILEKVALKSIEGCRKYGLFVAVDYLGMEKYNNDIQLALLEIIATYNAVNALYSNHFNEDIYLELTDIFLSTCDTCNPWPFSDDPFELINNYKEWVNNNSSSFDDELKIAQFWTGIKFDGFAGLAEVDGVCRSSNQPISISFISNDIPTVGIQKTLAAHELGHNFGCMHDDPSEDQTVMLSTISDYNNWSTTSINTINTFLNEQRCMVECTSDADQGYCSSNLFINNLTPTNLTECNTPLSVGSFVFIDNNGDGKYSEELQDSGLDGVELELYMDVNDDNNIQDDEFIARTTSHSGGHYIFEGLDEGNYMILIPNVPAEYPSASVSADRDDNNEDGDNNGVQRRVFDETVTARFNLTRGEETIDESGPFGDVDDQNDANGNMTIDFGFTPVLSIGSTIFRDENDNSIHDPGEVGVSGAKVTLFRAFNFGGLNFQAYREYVTETDESGTYFIENVPANFSFYRLEIDMPAGYLGPSSSHSNNLILDGDNNGYMEGDYLVSSVFKLAGNSQPTGDQESAVNGDLDDADDANGNMTIDIGLVPDPDYVEPPVQTEVDVQVFMEGGLTTAVLGDALYVEDTMRTTQYKVGILPGMEPKYTFGTKTPPGQPYNVFPWFHDEVEATTDYQYTADIVDWILVSVRTDFEKETELCQTAAWVDKYGNITYPNGFDCELDEGGTYRVAIFHRNHLPVVSPSLVMSNATLSYDFRTNPSDKKLFDYASAELLTRSGKKYYAMHSGNIYIGTIAHAVDVNSVDYQEWRKYFGAFETYMQADINLNGEADLLDREIYRYKSGIFSAIAN